MSKRLLIIIIFGIILGTGVGIRWFSANSSNQLLSVSDVKKGVERKSKENKKDQKQNVKPPQALQNLQPDNKETVHAQPKEAHSTAKDVMDRLISEFENSDARKLKYSAVSRLQQLKDFGEEGSKAIQEFLRTQQDIVLDDPNMWIDAGGMVPAHSLRIALLDTLYEMDDPTSRAANLEVLNGTSSGYEALFAARNLENFSPGTYREEALKAASDIMARFYEKPEREVLDIVEYYQARELIPQIEEFVGKNPKLLKRWMEGIQHFSGEDQVNIIGKILDDQKTREIILKSPSDLCQLDFRNNEVRKLITSNFNAMGEQEKNQFIKGIETSGFKVLPPMSMKPLDSNSALFDSQKDKIEGTLKLLDGLEPQLNSPELKTHLKDAREKLLEQLKWVE